MVIYSGFSHWKWWFSIATLNCQRVKDGGSLFSKKPEFIGRSCFHEIRFVMLHLRWECSPCVSRRIFFLKSHAHFASRMGIAGHSGPLKITSVNIVKYMAQWHIQSSNHPMWWVVGSHFSPTWTSHAVFMVDHGCIGFSSLAPRLYIWVVNQVLIVVPSGNSR